MYKLRSRGVRDYPTRQTKSGTQPGDPIKAAQALPTLVEAEDPPVRPYLGEDVFRLVERKRTDMKVEIDARQSISRSTDFT